MRRRGAWTTPQNHNFYSRLTVLAAIHNANGSAVLMMGNIIFRQLKSPNTPAGISLSSVRRQLKNEFGINADSTGDVFQAFFGGGGISRFESELAKRLMQQSPVSRWFENEGWSCGALPCRNFVLYFLLSFYFFAHAILCYETPCYRFAYDFTFFGIRFGFRPG